MVIPYQLLNTILYIYATGFQITMLAIAAKPGITETIQYGSIE